MKKHILFTIIGLCPILFALTGCDKDEKQEPLTSVFQTWWEGTRTTTDGAVEAISMTFESDTTGYGVHNNVRHTFEYKHVGKIIYMRRSEPSLIFSRHWWIYKMTQTQLELRASLSDPNYSETLTLNRVY